MNFVTFRNKLEAVQKSIAVTVPIAKQVNECYWGTFPKAVYNFPVVLNNMTENNRELGFGNQRSTEIAINMQLMVGPAGAEDMFNSELATQFWFAAKDAFDADPSLDCAVDFAVLNGADPTVPVIFEYAGQAYIGFNAIINITLNERFQAAQSGGP